MTSGNANRQPGKRIQRFGRACRGHLSDLSGLIWKIIYETTLTDEQKESARKFGPGYVIFGMIVRAWFDISYFLFMFCLVIGGAGYCGVVLWNDIPIHQAEWLHTDSPLLRPLVLGAYALVILLWVVPHIQLMGFSKLSEEQKFAMQNEARKTLAQIAGGAILLAGLYSSYRTLDVSREDQSADQYIKAVEQLGAIDVGGKPKMEVRTGGIYTLGRIAKTTDAEMEPVIEVLTTYLHSHVTRRSAPSTAKTVPKDVEAILFVLGRQLPYALQLQRLDLRNAEFSAGDFSDADFYGSDLRGADLVGADLSGANLTGVDLRSARSEGTNLKGVDLRKTRVDQKQIDVSIGDNSTQLPAGIVKPLKWPKAYAQVAAIAGSKP
jgi:hypothetical protein